MSRLVLVLWNAQEAEARQKILRRAGHDVVLHSRPDGEAHRALLDDPPEAFVIDLGRIPSHGRALGVWLRQQRATRSSALIFVGGAAEKVDRVRATLPDATFTTWRGVSGATRRALAKPPEHPIVPGTMDAYATSPLPKKLGLKPGIAIALLGAPARFERTLGPLPPGSRLKHRAVGRADLVLLFAKSQADLARRFPAALRALAPGGLFWIAWRKQSSGASTDLTQAAVRAYGLKRRLVDSKICSIDETWSGLRFTRRKK